MRGIVRWSTRAILLLLVGGLALWAYRLADHPPLASLRPQSVALRAADGSLLRLALASDDRYRLWLPLVEMPPALIEAVKLKEDRWFDWHPGVNPFSLVRGAALSYSRDDYRSGGSTLTMQLARLRDRSNTRSVSGKLGQVLDALLLSARYPKREVLAAYLNYAPYGGNIEGVGAASLIYFDKPAARLNLPEIMTLAVLPQRPRLRCGRAGDCLDAELRAARARLFAQWLQRHPEDARWQGLIDAPVVMRPARALPTPAPHFAEQVLAEARGRGPTGTRIDGTLDPRLQALVQGQIDRYLEAQHARGLRNAAALLVDSRDMGVRALVGSRDFSDAAIHGQVNGTLAKRSPGSTLKPFLYALAIDQGRLHPASVLRDVPTAFGSFTPENFDGRFMGPVTATQALVRSRNVPAVSVASRLSQPNLYQFLKRAGVRDLASEEHYGLALVLGGGEVSMVELARLYAMLSNDGVLRSLRYRQDDREETGAALLSAEASFIVRDMLQQNPRPDGGHTPLPLAWKTGTSWGFHDAWTAGIYGPYVLVVWLGNFDNRPEPALIGIEAAAPLFFRIVDAIVADDPRLAEPPRRWPLNLTRVEVCTASGDLPNAHCPDRSQTWFIPGKSPIKLSTLHREVLLDARSGKVLCAPDAKVPTRAVVYEYWPSDLADVFRHAGLARVQPPSDAHCRLGMAGAGSAPLITSPRRDATYLLPVGGGEGDAVVLQATVDADVRTLFWFADDALVAAVPPGAPVEWRPRTVGRYALRVVDDHGRAEERWVEIGTRR
jgi:penicillin-binding protein 1C